MSEAVVGEAKFLRSSDRHELEKLSSRRSNPQELIDPDLARRFARVSADLGVQLGVLLERDGRVLRVVVGTKDRLYLPDLGRFRLDPTKLRRLRLVVFMPGTEHRLSPHRSSSQYIATKNVPGKGERTVAALEIPDDFITDLEKLRLDLVAIISVSEAGLPGPLSVAHLTPMRSSASSRGVELYYGRDLFELTFDCANFIFELEAEINRSLQKSYDTKSEKAVLVGAYSVSAETSQASMDELVELAKTAGLAVVDTVIQRRRSLDPRTVIGKGKVEQLMLQCLKLGADLVIFDQELSPSQLRSITNITDLRIIDRSMLILDIFAQHAKSSEGRLQVELAQLKYSLPRLTEKDSGLSRLTGGIGGRGPGETKLEISRRRARDKISDLEKRIDKVAAQRDLRRTRRQERGVPVIAIVGYTNSGKSTLLNALTKAEVLAENKLFATLDPSSRRMRFPNEREVIFVDTVGFIRDLPKELVAAFRATLEEVGQADLLLHVVDAANPAMLQQIEVVSETLRSLGFAEKPRLLILNKIDRLSQIELRAVDSSTNGLAISALERTGFNDLIARLQEELLLSFQGQDPGDFLRSPTPVEDENI